METTHDGSSCHGDQMAAPGLDVPSPRAAEQLDVDTLKILTHTDKTHVGAPKQHPRAWPAPDSSQLLEPSVYPGYRPRARRLSEHGCGCCGLGLTLSNSPILETPAELQAAWARMPFIGELPGSSEDGPAIHPEAAREHARPAAEATEARPAKLTSPFAGLTLSIPDEQQPGAKHSSGGGGSSISHAAAAAALSNCLDDDGTPNTVFAIVSISFTRPAASPV